MASFEPKKIDLSKINGGQKYGYGGISPEAINAPIEASAWVQSLATNQPIMENNDNGGSPNVTIEEVNGTPRFKFENIGGKDFSQDVEQLQEVSTRNTNKVVAIENALIKVGTLAKQDGTLTEATQQTGGTGLLDFTIVDNSYATVKKIQGNTILVGNKLVNSKFFGIISNAPLSYGDNIQSKVSLPQSVELGKWDYIENGKIVKHTEIETFTSSSSWTVNSTDYGIFFATTPKKGKIDRASTLVSNIFPNRWANEGLPCLYSPKDTIVVFPNADKNNPTITTIEQWGNYLKELNDNGTPLTVAYPSENYTENDMTLNIEYLVWDKGQEIMQLENEAVPQVTNEYFVVLGGKE